MHDILPQFKQANGEPTTFNESGINPTVNIGREQCDQIWRKLTTLPIFSEDIFDKILTDFGTFFMMLGKFLFL